MFYPQNGDRIVTVDSMTSLHPICRPTFTVSVLVAQNGALFDVAVALKQLSDVLLVLLFVEHSNEQLPVLCFATHTQIDDFINNLIGSLFLSLYNRQMAAFTQTNHFLSGICSLTNIIIFTPITLRRYD